MLFDSFKVVSVFKVLSNAQTIPWLGFNSNIDLTCEPRGLEKTYLSDSLNTGCYPGCQRVFYFVFVGKPLNQNKTFITQGYLLYIDYANPSLQKSIGYANPLIQHRVVT